MSNSFSYDATNEQATDQLGKALAEVLPPGTTIALCGTLGAGKTRLVQAIAAESGIDRADVLSPTFVLVQKYAGGRTIYHLDAYRLRDEDEFRELGPEEFFESGGLTIIEWADKVAAALPVDYLRIAIEVTGTTSRRFTIESVGDKNAATVGEIERRLPQGAHAPRSP